MEKELRERLTRCEQANRQTRLMLCVSLTLLIVLAIGQPGLTQVDAQQSQVVDILRVAEIVIVDNNGVDRVRLSGQLPDAVINGKSIPRGEKAAGILLYDDTGQERGGYVTFSPSGNVALTLDTRKQQVALFAADAEDGAVARLWRGKDWVEMRTDAGGARLSIGRSDELVVQEPAISEIQAKEICSNLIGELEKLDERPSSEVVLRACKQRMTDSLCRSCLGLQ
ncbi:MAG: hypothetical protein GTN89_15065 [Acidobacteria bacterium]|nr:hypothetical protein [Acidobacteriota bacterium]NIM61529.1 hypothetical protein [Acidobacteriota bacterium]NIO60540.1 hypothetical protein [Acidobacteriota bacterium]NIQ31647.1 hypothetical protein [Acidobacteriota bacterium]NIQ86886.1 hypothetical protein [Acidobacteriota bacterium]